MYIGSAKFSGGFWVNAVLITLIVIYFLYQAFNMWRRSRISTLLDEEDFKEGMRKAQVIDLREKKDFDAGHILGARDIPYSQLKNRLTELRTDLPVYLYDQGRTLSSRAALYLSKKGYTKLYILRTGFQRWNGKTKKSKY
ncbi:rhodanese-like domain-containing protein [Pediococcus argentinicus]|uniref:rhodanese-like domain-containing protein n=1 Tax=Pediococcus argentinicus TaxID=480391 RepID=UPI00338EF478